MIGKDSQEEEEEEGEPVDRAEKMNNQMQMIQLLKEQSMNAYKQAKMDRANKHKKGGTMARRQNTQQMFGLFK